MQVSSGAVHFHKFRALTLGAERQCQCFVIYAYALTALFADICPFTGSISRGIYLLCP
jgi:hypothetical protein